MRLLFPSECLHCNESTKKHYLCPDCADLLTPLHTQGRCFRCFRERPCNLCRDSRYARAASAFPHYGPIRSLINALPHSPHLAKGCAGFLALQLATLKFPTPNLVIPAPSREPPYLSRALAKLLKRRPYQALKPAGRTGARLRKPKPLTNQILLLVTDVWDKRADEWADLLQSAKPAMLYGIALCEHYLLNNE